MTAFFKLMISLVLMYTLTYLVNRYAHWNLTMGEQMILTFMAPSVLTYYKVHDKNE